MEKLEIVSGQQNITGSLLLSEYADGIIRRHAAASMGAGVIPVALIDILTITAIQMDMVRNLCAVYQVPYSRTRVRSILTSLLAATLARAGARSLVKKVPVVGWILGGAAQAVFAGASTYAVGRLFKHHLSAGGNLMDFDTRRVKGAYAILLKKGAQAARKRLFNPKDPIAPPNDEATESNPS
jgi:uncharacterized protein (DUF697 family)